MPLRTRRIHYKSIHPKHKIKESNNQHETTLVYQKQPTERVASILGHCLDVLMTALFMLKPVFSVLAAITIFIGLLSFAYNKCHELVLDTVCPMKLISYYIPACQHHDAPVPDFSHFVKLQESLYDGMLQSSANSISAIELKQVELATRDLQTMIKYSNLQSHQLLDDKLGDYIARSRRFGRDIQILQAQTKGVIDNLITYNTYTLRRLSEFNSKKSSRQDLRALYEYAMSLVEKEAKRLILTIEKAQGSLDMLEEDLYAVHEISVQEQVYQKKEMPDVFGDLINMISGQGMRRPLVEENLALLSKFDSQRSKASQRLMVMLDRMEAFQMDLEELRSQVVAPILIPDTIPLEMHIENIGKAIERLKNGKVIDWNDTQKNRTIEDTPQSV